MARKRKLKAEDIITDHLSGMTDDELVNKYQISHALLDDVRKQLLIDGTIRVRDIVRDIRRGASDFELMTKYELSPEQLERDLGKLVHLGALRRAELYERSAFYDIPDNRAQTRRWSRTRARVSLPVYDADGQRIVGMVRDLSDLGIRVASLTPELGKEQVFLIRAEPFDYVEPFRFEASCRWVKEKKKKNDETYYLCGFEITHISEGAKTQLKKLLALLKSGA